MPKTSPPAAAAVLPLAVTDGGDWGAGTVNGLAPNRSTASAQQTGNQIRSNQSVSEPMYMLVQWHTVHS